MTYRFYVRNHLGNQLTTLCKAIVYSSEYSENVILDGKYLYQVNWRTPPSFFYLYPVLKAMGDPASLRLENVKVNPKYYFKTLYSKIRTARKIFPKVTHRESCEQTSRTDPSLSLRDFETSLSQGFPRTVGEFLPAHLLAESQTAETDLSEAYTAVHVRLGDFVGLNFPLPDENYYLEAITAAGGRGQSVVIFCLNKDELKHRYPSLFRRANRVIEPTARGLSRWNAHVVVKSSWTTFYCIASANAIVCSYSSFSYWSALLSTRSSVVFPVFKKLQIDAEQFGAYEIPSTWLSLEARTR
jgi:hypothetical protein